jgi:hypothetical protein
MVDIFSNLINSNKKVEKIVLKQMKEKGKVI